jgi:hypothetical protein
LEDGSIEDSSDDEDVVAGSFEVAKEMPDSCLGGRIGILEKATENTNGLGEVDSDLGGDEVEGTDQLAIVLSRHEVGVGRGRGDRFGIGAERRRA